MHAHDVVICADATPSMGTGHVMRCLALAQAAKQQGMTVRFVGKILVPWVRERLVQEHIVFTDISGEVPAMEVPEDVLARWEGTPTPDWVVFDGYHFGPDCQKTARAAGYKLLVIDDYAHLPEYSCDVLLNQNIGAEDFAYTGDIGKKLLGPKYALLRPEFLAARKQAEARQFPEKDRNILLTLGGGDFSGHLARIAPDFDIPELAGRTLRVIAGATPEKRIREFLRVCPANLEILGRVDDMPALLLNTDLCVTAGGSTCWELCCLGVPFLTVEVAENQRRIVDRLHAADIAPAFTRSSFSAALAKKPIRDVARRLMALVDGAGCRKVLEAITDTLVVTLRQALPEDCMAVFALANDAAARESSFSKRWITEEEHIQWYAERLRAEASPFYVAFFGNSLVGYARYDTTNTHGERVVSIAVAAEWRGKKIGAWLLQESGKRVFTEGADVILAWVKPENITSQKLFEHAGYISLGQQLCRGQIMYCFQLRAA